MHDRDVVILSSIDWGFLWQGPQEIATRLARAGNRVVYVENLGIRSPRPGDLRRVMDRLRHWAGGVRSHGLRRIGERLFLCSPLILPPFGGSFREAINRRFLVPSVARAIAGAGIRSPILWTFLPTDPARQVIRRLRGPGSVVVYYCAADFPALATRRRAMATTEEGLLRECDVAFAICRELEARCRRLCRESHVFPYGVDLAAFPSGTGATGVPPLLAGLRRPVVGYAGGLHRHVDFDLLKEMARARPDWSWVLTGTVQAATSGVEQLPNVFLTGAVPHQDLYRYLGAFDVGIVPYLRTEFTRTVVPVKINEYLAAGKPVVSADLPAVLEYSDAHPGAILTAGPEAGAFLGAIEAALRLPSDEEAALRRRAIAATADWEHRICGMTSLIEATARRNSGG